MAAVALLPGFGGQYNTTFSVVVTASAGTDTIDCSKCYTLAVTVTSGTSTAVQLQQAFPVPSNPTPAQWGWVSLSSVISAVSYGIIPATAGPFGIVRIIGTSTTAGMGVALTGFPIPRSW